MNELTLLLSKLENYSTWHNVSLVKLSLSYFVAI